MNKEQVKQFILDLSSKIEESNDDYSENINSLKEEVLDVASPADVVAGLAEAYEAYQEENYGPCLKLNTAVLDIDEFFIKLSQVLSAAKGEVEEEVFETACSAFELTYQISVIGGEDWEPTVMPTGAMLIRNHHRVIGLLQPLTKLEMTSDAVKAAYDQMVENSDDDSRLSMLTRLEDGSFYHGKAFSKPFSKYGETLIFMSSEDSREGTDFEEFGWEFDTALDNTRAGNIVLRVFENCTFIHPVGRLDDDFDSAMHALGNGMPVEEDEENVCTPDIFSGHLQEEDISDALVEDVSCAGCNFIENLNEEGVSEDVKTLLTAKFKEMCVSLIRSQSHLPAVFSEDGNEPAGYSVKVPFFKYSAEKNHAVCYVGITKLAFDEKDDISPEDIKDKVLETASDLHSRFNDYGSDFDPSVARVMTRQYPEDVPGNYLRRQPEELAYEVEDNSFWKSFNDKLLKALEDAEESYADADWDVEFSDLMSEAMDAIPDLWVEIRLDEPKSPAHLFTQLARYTADAEERLLIVYPAYGFQTALEDGDEDTGNQHMLMTEQEHRDANDRDDDDEDYDDEDED